MKRAAWFLLAIACSAFVRVQPVELLNPCPCICRGFCHCKVPGACGMPCCGAPTPAWQALANEQTAGIRGVARRSSAHPPQLSGAPYLAPGSEVTGAFSALAPSALVAPAARVPLFKAHCSFLI
jgi:hypothetical protein